MNPVLACGTVLVFVAKNSLLGNDIQGLLSMAFDMNTFMCSVYLRRQTLHIGMTLYGSMVLVWCVCLRMYAPQYAHVYVGPASKVSTDTTQVGK